MTDEVKEQITSDQHYVPQFYLKQWLDDSGGFYPVRVDSKSPPRLKIFNDKSNQSRFCYENFFYAQYTGVQDEISQIIEKEFAIVEGLFSKELPLLEKKILNYEQITETDKYHLAEMMIFLYFKGKKYLDQSKKMTNDLTKQIMRLKINYADENSGMRARLEEAGLTKEQVIDFLDQGKIIVDYGNMHHLQIMKDMHGFCNLLAAKFWKILISHDGEFIATDAPYTDISLGKTYLDNDFFSREQSFILSPRVLIIAMNPKDLHHGKKLVRKDITKDRAFVQQINARKLMNSIRFGFHKDRILLLELERFVDLIYQSNIHQ